MTFTLTFGSLVAGPLNNDIATGAQSEEDNTITEALRKLEAKTTSLKYQLSPHYPIKYVLDMSRKIHARIGFIWCQDTSNFTLFLMSEVLISVQTT